MGVTICMMWGVSARGRERRREQRVMMTSFTRPGSVLAGSLLLRMWMKEARKSGRVGRRSVLIASWREGGGGWEEVEGEGGRRWRRRVGGGGGGRWEEVEEEGGRRWRWRVGGGGGGWEKVEEEEGGRRWRRMGESGGGGGWEEVEEDGRKWRRRVGGGGGGGWEEDGRKWRRRVGGGGGGGWEEVEEKVEEEVEEKVEEEEQILKVDIHRRKFVTVNISLMA